MPRYFTTTVTQSLIRIDVGLCKSSMTRKRTLNAVPDVNAPPTPSSKCAAPAPDGDVVTVTSGPALGMGNEIQGPVQAGSPTLRSGARCTRYVVFGDAPLMCTTPCTWNVPWSSAVGVT